MQRTPAYEKLQFLFSRLSTLSGALSMLHWDMSAMMPEGGAAARERQLTLLKTMHHEMLASDEVRRLLDQAADEDLESVQRANLAEMRRDWVHASAAPPDLVAALSRASSLCEMTWRKARKEGSFKKIIPHLTELVGLVRRMAEVKSQALGVSPYDALLDEYEPDARSAQIDPLFEDLEAFLPDFIAKVIARQPDAPPAPKGPFAIADQRAVSLEMMKSMGFSFEHGRLDESLHPFCGGIAEDVRITTRYDKDDFLKSLFGVIHETGHALYEQGLPTGFLDQPVGRARSMGVHESQSLLMEMQVCRSPEFISFLAPRLAAQFGGVGAESSPEWQARSLQASICRVTPGFIRVDADEATYPLHVILRYRLEKALIEGDLDVKDLPSAWNSGFSRMMGFAPPNDALGCLQDIHWYDGAIGYFPTYTLGAIMAAQFYDAAKKANPDIPDAIGRGDFSPLVAWLRKNVHSVGSLLSAENLLLQASGRRFDVQTFKDHLTRRYLS